MVNDLMKMRFFEFHFLVNVLVKILSSIVIY
jgi:hypothetical protein